MDRILLDSIASISDNEYVDKKVLHKFRKRIKKGTPYTRDEGADIHFCTFLAPVNVESQSIYIGHHIKADSWMPPGGHIDKNETPIGTVKREWKEELGRNITAERIQLFDISIIQIERSNNICKTHFDFWHLIHSEIQNFQYDKREFHEAGWYEINIARKLVKNPVYISVMDKLAKYFFKV